jgi:hypothetical protein
MRMTEMSESQRHSHHTVVSTLVAAGWEPQRDQLAFEEGEWTVYDIDMQRSNGRARLRVFRDPTTDELGLAIVMTEGVLGLYFKLRSGSARPCARSSGYRTTSTSTPTNARWRLSFTSARKSTSAPTNGPECALLIRTDMETSRSKMPLVSCVMPTADRRRFVPRAIALFLAQDYPDRELLIVDDGADRVEDLVPEDPRVRYVALERRLVLGAKRNLACEQARGDLIVHWDDDDWSAPWRLRYQVEQLIAASADVGGLNRVLFYDPAADEAWEYDYPRSGAPWVYGATLVYTRSFWRRNPFAPLTVGEDSVGEDSRFVWASVPKRLSAHGDSRFFVATVHAANTSRKDTRGHRWRRYPASALPELMRQEGQHAR